MIVIKEDKKDGLHGYKKRYFFIPYKDYNGAQLKFYLCDDNVSSNKKLSDKDIKIL